MIKRAGEPEEIAYKINPENQISVFVQIENQIQFAIASGRIKAGDNLPSVRNMSDMLRVNPNTVAKAYRDLELVGLVHARRGVGYTVVEEQVEGCRERIQAQVLDHLREAISESLACGISPARMREIMREALGSGNLPY